MNPTAVPNSPFYKRAGFWLWTLVLVIPSFRPKEEGVISHILTMLWMAAISLAIWNFFYQKKKKKKLIAAYNSERRQLQEDEITSVLERGLQEVTASKAFTKRGEVCYFSGDASLYEQVSKGTKHSGSSVRFRVAKGVYFSTGGGRSSGDSEVVAVSDGELVATNQRIIFAGDKKSFELPHGKLLNIEYVKNSVFLNVSDRKSAYVMAMSERDIALLKGLYPMIRKKYMESDN